MRISLVQVRDRLLLGMEGRTKKGALQARGSPRGMTCGCRYAESRGAVLFEGGGVQSTDCVMGYTLGLVARSRPKRHGSWMPNGVAVTIFAHGKLSKWRQWPGWRINMRLGETAEEK